MTATSLPKSPKLYQLTANHHKYTRQHISCDTWPHKTIWYLQKDYAAHITGFF